MVQLLLKHQRIGCCKFWNDSCDINNDLVSVNKDVELIEFTGENYLVITVVIPDIVLESTDKNVI